MGFGERRGGHRAHHHHNRHHHNRHHHRNHGIGHRHHHHHTNFAGLFRRSQGPAHPLQRRVWSGFIMVMVGLALFCYGIVNISINSFYGYSYQGTVFVGVGAVLALCGVIVILKMYHLYRSQESAEQPQGGAVFIQGGAQGNAASTVQLQQQQPATGVWTTGQSGTAGAPPAGFGAPPQGYPAGAYPPQYPPGGQPPYGQPPYGQPAYGQPPYTQPTPGGPEAPPQPWQGGMAPPATADGTQFYQVQPASQPPDQTNANPPANDGQGPPVYSPVYPPSDVAPPSYDEATKPAQIP